MAKVAQPHPGHTQHLCYLVNMGALGTSSYAGYKKLVKNATWICRSCGRSAASPKSLCNPKKL
jgi:hypothetical protein